MITCFVNFFLIFILLIGGKKVRREIVDIVWRLSNQDPPGTTKNLEPHVYLGVKTPLWLNKNVPNRPRLPDISPGSKMGYLAIKTSEWETNFYRRCLNSEPKPAAAPGSSSEGILSDWISAFGRQADTVWSCPLSFLWRVGIIWHYLVTRWHYLTVSWHCHTRPP